MLGNSLESALNQEWSWLDGCLTRCLAEQRARGRTAIADGIGGAVIEEGEAEGLLRSLSEVHAASPPPPSLQAAPGRERSALSTLEHARSAFGLEPLERDLLLVALSVEVDDRYARLVAFLNDHFKMNRPTVGLAIEVVCGNDEPARAALLGRLTREGPLLRRGLLQLEGDGPLVARSLRIPEDFWPRLVGIDTTPSFPLVGDETARLEELALGEGTLDSARAAIERVRSSGTSLVVVTGPKGSGREALAAALALAISGRGLTVDLGRAELVDAVHVAREARWHSAAPILLNVDGVPPAALRGLLAELGPTVIAVGRENALGALMPLTTRPVIEVAQRRPSHRDRSRIWKRLLPADAASVDLELLSARYPFGPGRIECVARLVRAEAGSGQGSSLVTADVAQACRRLSVLEVGPLAERLSSPYTRDDLVVSPELRRELDLVTAWSRHGLRAFDGAGPGRNLRVGPGLACLFHGPPGTGKTMAAQALARDAGFEIYRIDLSQVVNKYIGETEKNLSRVFDAAEDANCLLFFDEADSLFGRRSEIKDAHDRYANIETGYLLQRLESYRGLVILATNLRKNLDEAFLRRLQVVAEFPIPSPAERSRIWSRLLPSRAERAADVDVELLSERFAVAGGSIKNAIFTATLLAAEAGSPLGMRHLMLGLSRELKKSGRVADASAFAGWMPEPARGA